LIHINLSLSHCHLPEWIRAYVGDVAGLKRQRRLSVLQLFGIALHRRCDYRQRLFLSEVADGLAEGGHFFERSGEGIHEHTRARKPRPALGKLVTEPERHDVVMWNVLGAAAPNALPDKHRV